MCCNNLPIYQFYVNLILLGSVVLDPKTPHHPNDAIYEQPNRVYIDNEWTDVLRSRYMYLFLVMSDIK